MKTYGEQLVKIYGDNPTIEKDGPEWCCRVAELHILEKVRDETIPALDRYRRNPSFENLVDVASGLIDSVAVLLNVAHSLDIPFDAVWDEVYRCRSIESGRENGEIEKPDIFGIMMEYKTKMEMGEEYMRTGMVK